MMKKKRVNLALLAFLLGGVTTVLPTLGRIIIFTGISVYLFLTFDFWEYEQRCNGGRN